VSDARLVVEAVADNLSVKGLVYPEIVASCRTDAVFGSATMNLPLDVVQELLPETWRPRLIGLRFLAPILAISLVEVTHVNLESRAPVKEVLDMMIAVGKTVVAGPTSTPHFSPRAISACL
jgi:3-hydroxyacyl-CoA dehydrogenase